MPIPRTLPGIMSYNNPKQCLLRCDDTLELFDDAVAIVIMQRLQAFLYFLKNQPVYSDVLLFQLKHTKTNVLLLLL